MSCAVYAGLTRSRGKQLKLTQRTDFSFRIGKLKSKAAYRSIPCPPIVLNALCEWKLASLKGDLDLALPNGFGKVESHSSLLERGLGPILLAAGITELRPVLDEVGKPVLDAAGAPKAVVAGKYGMHSLRHACASLWIENGHNPKQIQRLMGHSSIKATFDVYGHLFQTLTRINAPPKHCRPDCSGANLMLERFKSLFRQNKVIAPSSPLHLDAKSERELSAALKGLPVGASGWISKSEAAKLYSSTDDAFDEWNSAGKLALSEFAAFAEHRCNFHLESDRVIFTRK